MMIGMVLTPPPGTPEDARMLAWNDLKTLKTSLAGAKGRNLDEYSRIHIEQSLDVITRALDARITISANGTAPAGSFISFGATPNQKQ